MADNTSSVRNVVISLDVENSRIKLMKILGISFEDAVIEFLPFDKGSLFSNEYDSMLISGLKPFVEKADLRMVNFYLVLPDELFASWKVSIPVGAKVKVEDALKDEIEKDLGNPAAFQYNTTLVSQDKNVAVYHAEAINLEMLNKIKKALKDLGIEPKVITSRSVSVANAVLALRVRARKGNYALVDVRKKSTSMVYVGQSKSLGGYNVPFGYEILRTDRIVDEELLYSHESVSIVLSEAMETTNTVYNGEELEEEFEPLDNQTSTDDDISLGQEERQAEAQKKFEEAEQYALENTGTIENDSEMDVPKEEKADTGTLSDSKALNLTGRLFDTTGRLYNTAGLYNTSQLSSTFDLQATGRLSTTDLFTTSGLTLKNDVLQNFRIFMKQINLFVENCNKSMVGIPDVEYILVNIPKRYSFLLTKANSERGNSAEYKYFNPTFEDKPDFTENLDLYGILHSKVYNVNQTHS